MSEQEEMMNSTGNSSTTPVQAMTPSGISERQNEPKNLHLLAAQRQLYRDEKKYTGFWYLGSVVIAMLAVAASVSVFTKPHEPLIVLFWFLFAVGEFALLPNLRKPRIEAAIIQEKFDCDVLDLEWNDALAKEPDSKIIERAVERFNSKKNRDREWKRLENWYESPAIKDEPIHIARIACIKENIRWDSGQRREWASWIKWITIGILILLAVAGIQYNLLLKQYFSGLFLLIIPLLIAVYGHFSRHTEAAKRLDHLEGVLKDLYRDAIRQNADIEEITRRTRYLQTEICHHRMEDEPVLDWFYNKLGKKYAPAQI